jgi:hypothetical protein
MGTSLLEMKMNDMALMYHDFKKWKDSGNDYVIDPRTKRKKRVWHPWENLKMSEFTSLSHAILALTNAKHHSIMLDKFIAAKLDIPKDELLPQPQDVGENSSSHRITFEGKHSITNADLQNWFDQFYDKPSAVPHEEIVDPNKAIAPPVTKQVSEITTILDDNGRPIG